jgi:hypothetical protein
VVRHLKNRPLWANIIIYTIGGRSPLNVTLIQVCRL